MLIIFTDSLNKKQRTKGQEDVTIATKIVRGSTITPGIESLSSKEKVTESPSGSIASICNIAVSLAFARSVLPLPDTKLSKSKVMLGGLFAEKNLIIFNIKSLVHASKIVISNQRLYRKNIFLKLVHVVLNWEGIVEDVLTANNEYVKFSMHG